MSQQTLVQQAIAAIRQGRKTEARQLLEQALEQDPAHTTAWLWLTEAVETDQERLHCLQRVLEIDPQHPGAQRGLQLLQARQTAPQADAATEPPAAPLTLNALLADLRDARPQTRLRAAQTLGRLDHPRALKALVAALPDRDDDVRQAIIAALVKIGEPALAPLAAALHSRTRPARQAAGEALIKLGPRAVEVIVPLLRHKDKQARRAAAETLDKLGWQPPDGELQAAWRIARAEWDACVKLGEPAVKPLIAVLRDLDNTVRLGAVRALDKLGDPRAIEPLVAALRDRDEHVRQAATKALLKIGRPAIEPLTVVLLQWNSHRLRQRVAEVLDELGWLPQNDEIGATYWVAKMDWERCVEIGPPAIPPLVATLRDRDSGIRWAAAETLDQLGWKPGQDETGATYWVAKSEWSKCIGLGAPAVGPLIAVLRDRESWVRQAALQALERIGGAEARAAVEEWKRQKL